MLECTDIAFLTLDDEDALWGQQPVEDVIARTHNAGVKEVVVKRGADSCLVSIAGEGLVDVPAAKLPKEKVIDTTAAGDSFSAGYLAVRLTGGSAENAAKRGHLPQVPLFSIAARLSRVRRCQRKRSICKRLDKVLPLYPAHP
ncbi:PfkB family carbohydrate kinase [Escherichia coli]